MRLPDDTRNAPRRIQLRRLKGWRLRDEAPDAVIVDRRADWGNPWTVTAHGPEWVVRLDDAFPVLASRPTKAEAVAVAIEQFRRWLTDDEFAAALPARFASQRRWILRNVHGLHGLTLACWCAESNPCHADVLIDLAAKHHATLAAPSPEKGS